MYWRRTYHGKFLDIGKGLLTPFSGNFLQISDIAFNKEGKRKKENNF